MGGGGGVQQPGALLACEPGAKVPPRLGDLVVWKDAGLGMGIICICICSGTHISHEFMAWDSTLDTVLDYHTYIAWAVHGGYR